MKSKRPAGEMVLLELGLLPQRWRQQQRSVWLELDAQETLQGSGRAQGTGRIPADSRGTLPTWGPWGLWKDLRRDGVVGRGTHQGEMRRS